MVKRALTAREKTLLIIAAAGLLIYVLAALVISPLHSEWVATNEGLQRAQLRYLSALKTARETQEIRELRRNASEAGMRSETIPEFLREIEQAAGTQVVIRRFQPLQHKIASRRSRSAGPKIMNQQIQIDCTGTLAGLMAFIQTIESKNRFTRLRHLHLSPDHENPQQLRCQLILVRLAAG